MRRREFISLVGAAAVAGLVAIAATIYVCYRFAERTVGVLGENGTNVLVRLSAFILLCIGVQIAWNGMYGTTGFPHVDVLIADASVLPQDDERGRERREET